MTSPALVSEAEQHPERPAEIVELSELLYRGIFGSGMLVAAIVSLYGAMISAFQPDGYRLSGGIACAVLLVLCLATVALRAPAYRALRRSPWLITIPAVAVGAGAFGAGAENQQLFYVITLVLGVTGLAVPFSWLVLATVIAALGAELPVALGGGGLSSTAVAAITVPTVFWLIIDRLARYMLRINELTEREPNLTATVPGSSTPDAQTSTGRQPGGRWLPSRRRPAELMAGGDSAEPPAASLGARQLQVVLLCAEGLNHVQIAACLEIGPQQVRRHLRKAREATGARTSAELVAWALRQGLIPRHGAPQSL